MSKTRRILFWVSVLAANGLLGLPSPICIANDDGAETTNSVALLVAAASAQTAGNVEDAGYLYYAAQARFQIDKRVYPPKETGGDAPGVLQASLSLAAGQSIVQAVTGDPDIYLNVIKRLSQWSPKFPKEYDPGWEYENALGKDAAARVVADIRKSLLTPLGEKAVLLANEEYRLLTKEVGQTSSVEQRYWAAVETNRGVNAVADDLKTEFSAATSRKTAAATRMKEIEWELNPASRWHSTVNWNAADYFEDPLVIELCHAIERNDVEQMNRLIAAGANVNAQGKDGMTLLLWSFPDRKLERFRCLLKHGANPNVFFSSDFNVGYRPFHPYPAGGHLFDDRGCHAGQTVTHLACRSPVYEYMKLVFTHGGDPNVVDTKTKETPIGVVLSRLIPNKKERVELLIDKGSNPNKYCEYRGGYPAVLATQSHAYDAALVLVRAGADPNMAKPRDDRTLVHWVLLHEEHLPFSDAKQNSDYDALVKWLKEHDVPFEKARADLNRKGRPWGKELKRQRDEELAQRQAAEEVKAQERTKKLEELKSVKPEAPESAEQWVKTLDESDLSRIELPDDLGAKVFVMHQGSSPLAEVNEPHPWITVYANGRIACHSRMSKGADHVSGTLSKDELTWLMHLAVNECRLLERKTADYEVKNSRNAHGYFSYQLIVKSGSNQLQLPLDALVIKSLRRKLDLDALKELHTYVGNLANRVHLGDEREAERILEAVNNELERQHPDLPGFGLHHLALADRCDGSRFVCSFNRKIDLGDRQIEEVTAVYVLEDKQPKVTVNVRKYTQG